MRYLILAGAALGGGYFLLTRRRTGGGRMPPPPLTTRQHHDRLANRLEVALSHGNRPLWEETSDECRRVSKEDLPVRKREESPEWAERIDGV